MKKYILPVLMVLAGSALRAQTVNWGGLQQNDKQFLHAHAGANYGMVFGIGYGYKLTGNRFPVIAQVEYSFPAGQQLFDDFKTKFGGQVRLVEVHDFHLSVKAQGVFRRYENELVRLLNWGVDMSGAVGYYCPRWFVAAEFGFDKAISTHFKHSDQYKSEYPDVQDGWYQPATGGNFNYGLLGGVSFGKHDVTVKGGFLRAEDFKTKPLLPFYVQLGYNYRLGGFGGR